MMVLPVLSTAVGVALIVIGLADVFQTLVHPGARGRISRLVIAGIWRLTAPFGRVVRAAGGPLATICVIAVWTGMQALGWALVYLPHIPDGFSYSEGIEAPENPEFGEALYFSLVSLATLGFGEVVAIDAVLRLLAPLQALTGFALITGAASWLMQLFPAVARRRAAAMRLSLLADAGYPEHLLQLQPATASAVLRDVAHDLAVVRVDLGQLPESYYFREGEVPTSLGHALPVAARLADAAGKSPVVDVRLGGVLVDRALEELGGCLRDAFGARGESRAEVLEAFARDQG